MQNNSFSLKSRCFLELFLVFLSCFLFFPFLFVKCFQYTTEFCFCDSITWNTVLLFLLFMSSTLFFRLSPDVLLSCRKPNAKHVYGSCLVVFPILVHLKNLTASDLKDYSYSYGTDNPSYDLASQRI